MNRPQSGRSSAAHSSRWTGRKRCRERTESPAERKLYRGDLARQALVLSRAGLASRAILDSKGNDETHYIDPLDAIVESGQTPAEGLLEAYHGYWNGNIDALFTDCMY